MSLQIREVLHLSSMKDAKLIGGCSGLDNTVTNIIVMEAPDIEKWMEPGQLLLTSLFGMQNYTDAQVIKFIKQVSVQKGSGVIVKINRFVKEIPKVMIESCNELAIPLICIPLERRYMEIMTEVMQILFNNKVFMLNYYHNVHIHFNKLALKQPSFLQMLILLQSFLDNPVALLNHQSELLCATDPCLESLELHSGEAMDKMDFMTYDYERFQIQDTGGSGKTMKLIRALVPNIGNDYHYLLIAEKNGSIRPVDFMAIENAISFLQMELIKKFALSEMRQNYINDLIDDLISGKISGRERMQEVLADLNLSESEDYRIVVVRLLPKQDVKDKTQNKKQLQRFMDKFSEYWSYVLYRIRSDRLLFILPCSEYSAESFKERVSFAMTQVLHNSFDDSFYYHICIGVSCRVEQFQKYSYQVLRALKIASSMRTGSFVVSVDDMGIYRYLIDIADDTKLLELVPPPLLRLVDEDADLATTLLVFLDNNQNLKQSAEHLYIHPKTIRYRIDKIQVITKINFDDPEQLLQYNMGFRILRMMGQLGANYTLASLPEY